MKTPNHFRTQDMKILLVDDTPANLDILGKTLSPEGYQLAVARSGEKALKIARHMTPDLVLLDIMMPQMDGFEACRQLLSEASLQHTRVIFISAKIDPEEIRTGLDCGAVDFMMKPFRQEDVCRKVRIHLELQAAHHTLSQLRQGINQHITAMQRPTEALLAGCNGAQPATETFQDMRMHCETIQHLVAKLLNLNNTPLL